MYQIELIEYRNQFIQLKQEWNDVANAMPRPMPFFYHEWFHAFYEACYSKEPPLIIRISKNRQLVGFLPLSFYNTRYRNVPMTVLGFPNNPDTCVNDLIGVDSGCEVIVVVFEWLNKNIGSWDALHLTKVPNWGLLHSSIQTCISNKQLRYYETGIHTNLYLTPEQSWDDYYNTRTRNFRKSNRGVQNRLNRQGSIDIESHSSESETFLTAFEELLEVSANCWKKDSQVALYTQPISLAFFRELIYRKFPDSCLWIHLLRKNGKAIAYEFDISSNNKVYALRADYHSDFHTDSPGNYLDYHLMKRVFDSNINMYEFGPGLNSYKLRWTENGYQTKDIMILNRSFKARTCSAFFSMLERASKIKKSLNKRPSLMGKS